MTASWLRRSGFLRYFGPLACSPEWAGLRAGVAVFLALSAGAGKALSQGDKVAENPRQWEDFAEVYVDRYIEPAERLKLNAESKLRSRVLTLFAVGRGLEERGQIERAVKAYREVLELAPSQAKLARKVGFMLARSGDPEGGRKVLEDSLKNNPGSHHSYLVLSDYLATFQNDSKENREEALRLAEEAVEKFPGQPDVYDHAVKLYLIARQPRKAQALLDGALKRKEPNPFFWLRLAETAKRVWPLSTNQGAEPVRINGIYEEALKRAPENSAVQERVADHYRDSRQFDRARELYETLIDIHPDRLDLRKNLAAVFAALGKDEKRIEILESVVRINPQDAETHKELGRVYETREDIDNAIDHFRQGLRLAPGTVNEYIELGQLMLNANRGEDAARLLERGAYLYPSQPGMPILLARAYARIEEWEDSVDQYEKAVTLASESRPDLLGEVFYFSYAAAVERAGDIDRAANLFRKSIELLAQNDDGREDKRRQDFRATLYNYLGYMWLENDMNIDEAGSLIQQAYQLNPESGAITDSIGWWHFKKGRFDEAARDLKKAIGMMEGEPGKDDAVMFDHLAQALYQLGKFSEAVENLKKATELDPENEEFSERLAEYQKKAPKPADKPKDTPAESESEKPGSKSEPPAGKKEDSPPA